MEDTKIKFSLGLLGGNVVKLKKLFLMLGLLTLLLAGCKKDDTDDNNNQTSTIDQTQDATDAISSASILSKESDFEKALGKNGTWIIAALNDMTFTKDIVLEGDFKNSKGETQRKVALYSQDANRVVTARYTLTAPKFTIRSPKASIQHGNFKGDLYVETTDFQLIDAKVEGNIYFISEEAKTGFTMDSDSSVSGKQEVLPQ